MVGTWGVTVGRGDSRQEHGELRWRSEESGWECREWGGNAGNQGGNAENQGANAGNQGGNAGNRGGNVGNRMEYKQKKTKEKLIKSNFRNIKPYQQGLMLSFSRNDQNQQYYLNGMWACGPPVMMLNFLSSNEKVRFHFTQGC